MEALLWRNRSTDQAAAAPLVTSWGNWQDASLQSLTCVWVGGAFVPTRTQTFHHFLKLALTKNPKKRPTAEKLLQVGGRG